MNIEKIEEIYNLSKKKLLENQILEKKGTYWTGSLSPSALATSASIGALSIADKEKYNYQINRGISWLKKTQRSDGGWGVSIENKTDFTTTCLVYASFILAGKENDESLLLTKKYIDNQGGFDKINTVWGNDFTYSVPVNATLLLAGVPDVSPKKMPNFPFWLALFPKKLFTFFGLRVVIIALPALISLGILIYKIKPKESF